MAKNVFIHWVSGGCSRRKLDAKKFSKYFLKNDCEIVDNPKKSDIIILVTCAFSDKMAEQSLKKIEEFKKYDAELIVTGCLPAIDKEKLSNVFDGKTIATKEIAKIDDIFKDNEIKFIDLKDANHLWANLDDINIPGIVDKTFVNKTSFQKFYNRYREYLIKKIFGENSSTYYLDSRIREDSFYLRISWGCMSKCTYCAIRNAIGPLKSKPFDQIMDEFKKGLSQGAKNFIIAADDIGSYGIDIGRTFAELLDEITRIEGDYKIEIEEIHPGWIVKYIDDFEEILKRNKIIRICPPIQSGSVRILKIMNRFSDKEKIKDAFLRLKKADSNVVLGTYFIAGFPSETKEEFQETLEFVKDIRFDWGIAIPFSLKKDTLAEKINPKITPDEIKNRMKLTKKFLRKNNYYVSKVKDADRLFFNIKQEIQYHM